MAVTSWLRRETAKVLCLAFNNSSDQWTLLPLALNKYSMIK